MKTTLTLGALALCAALPLCYADHEGDSSLSEVVTVREVLASATESGRGGDVNPPDGPACRFDLTCVNIKASGWLAWNTSADELVAFPNS